MAEIIVEPTALSKVIPLKFKINDVDVPKTTQLSTNKQFNTTDTDAWFSFELDGLASTNGTYDLTLINLDDKSIFHHDNVLFAALPFHYRLNSSEDITLNEIRHAGRWIGQLVVTMGNGDTTSRQFGFNISGHILDGQDAQVILLSDYQALVNTINLAKDDLAQYNVDYAALLVDIADAEDARVTAYNQLLADQQANIEAFDVALDDGIVAANLATKLQTFEATNNSRLLSAERQLADIAKPIVCFTFDDGLAADSLTYTIFKEYGYPASFGLITDTLYNTNKNSLNNYKDYEKDGFEILSHSSSHAYLDTAKSDAVRYREMQVSADKLRTLGFSANGFIVPFSTIEAGNLAYAKTVYDYTLIGGNGLNGKNGFKLKKLTRVSAFGSGVVGSKALIDQAIADKRMLIFYDHAIGAAGSLTEAEWREILTYAKNRMAYNYMEVHNLKNAIAKYYGIATHDRSKKLNEYNQAPSINSPSWVFEDNTAVATKFADVNFANETLRVTIPNGAAIGSGFSLSNTITLPASLEALGERTRFGVKLKLGNSQYTYFNNFLDVSYLDSTGAVLLTKSKQIYPDNFFGDNYFIDIYPEYPLVPKDIVKIKIAVRFAVATSPTVNHPIYLSDVKLNFPLVKDKITTGEIGFTSITGATPDVTNKKYLYVNNASTTTITNLLSDYLSQEVTLIFGNANTTITGNNLIRLADGLNLTPTAGSVLTLVKFGSFSSAWYEKSRAIRTV